MSLVFGICLALAHLEPSVAEPDRFQTCLAVGLTASGEGVDPSLAIALAWHESSMLWVTSRAGAVGPLQVIPRWGCPKVGPCDLIRGGLYILKAHLRRRSTLASIAHYNAGRSPGRRAWRWARHVVRLHKQLTRTVEDVQSTIDQGHTPAG